MKNKFVKKLGWALCFVVLFFSLIYLKVFFSSRSEFRSAEAALAKGDYQEAIAHYERSMLWYLPVGGYVESSAEGLWKIGETLEKENPTLALEAYRSLRSALYATRSFYTPGKGWIDRSDQKIVLLMAQEPPYSEAEKKKAADQRAAEALAVQKVPQKPDPGWSIVLEVGFWGWVAGVLLFIWVGFNTERQVILKRGLVLGALIIFFYALWILGMMKA